MPFQLVDERTLPDQVMDQIRAEILNGQLLAGQRVVESDIAKQMGLSRNPVREALRRLEAEGLVEAKPRRGFFVRCLSRDEVVELYDIRMLLESDLCRYAAENATPQGLRDIAGIVARMRECERKHDWLGISQLDLDFHAAVGKLSGRRYTGQLLDLLTAQLHMLLTLHRETYLLSEGIPDEHAEILEALRSHEPELAAQVMKVHLEFSCKQLLERLDAVAGSSAEQGR